MATSSIEQASSSLKQTKNKQLRPARHQRQGTHSSPVVEPLDRRVMMAVSAVFAGGTLFVSGDDQDDVITISRTAGGTILVNNGAIPLQGATVANTAHFHLVGGGGNDRITLDQTNGALPGAALFGGAGNDVLTGGSGIDFADGGAGNDTISLGAGEDDFQWNPGDGSDVVDGGAGRDAIQFNGSDVAEQFALSAVGDHARLTRDVGGITMDFNDFEELNVNAFGGADTITVNDQLLTGLNTVNLDLSADAVVGDNQPDAVVINGSNSDDVSQISSVGTTITAVVSFIPFVNITGSEGGLDTLTVNTLGGNDIVDASDLAATNASQLIKLSIIGGAGDDSLTGSQGFDTFVWNPGDGNDSIDGGAGEDTMVFNGSEVAEQFNASPSGGRVRFTRDVGGTTTDLGGVEEIDVNTLGGADAVTVNDLSGTGIEQIRLNLAATLGGTVGDGQVDSVVVNGRNQNDLMPVLGANGLVAVDGGFADGSGLPYFIVMQSVEATDALRVNGNGGDDTIDASALQTPVKLTANGGSGNDVLLGTDRSDVIVGGPGNDRAFLGDGNDSFTWNAGDGLDTVEGMAGTDTLNFNGSGLNETIAVSANGPQVRVTNDVGGVVINVDGVELLAVNALGGTDNVVVNNLAGTALTNVKVTNIIDGQPDDVTVNASDNAETIDVTGDVVNGVRITGLAALVDIKGAIGVPDLLTVNALGGADTVDASGLAADAMILALNGGNGNDVVTGGAGDAAIKGGAGTDTINILGAATPGSTTVLGSAGDDTVNVNTGGVGFVDVTFDATQRFGALNIGSGGVVTLTSGGDKVLTVTSLGIAGTGELDLSDNNLIVDYSQPTIAGIESLLARGFAAGAWTGHGIRSSAAAADAQHETALGVAEATDLFGAFPATFRGQTVDNTSVLISYTLYGDANLDEKVDLTDFTQLAANFNKTAKRWSQGNFNFDAAGAVDLTDFAFLATNFNQTLPAPAAELALATPTPTPAVRTTTTSPTVAAAAAVRAGGVFAGAPVTEALIERDLVAAVM
jgi:Ca2+-binding RTX toxin-like protein